MEIERKTGDRENPGRGSRVLDPAAVPAQMGGVRRSSDILQKTDHQSFGRGEGGGGGGGGVGRG